MKRGIRKQIFTEHNPPKIPSTASTFGNTIETMQVDVQKPAHIIILALVVKIDLPVIRLYKFNLNGIVSKRHFTISIIITPTTAII